VKRKVINDLPVSWMNRTGEGCHIDSSKMLSTWTQQEHDQTGPLCLSAETTWRKPVHESQNSKQF
jgi:hypothetical protein